MGHNFKMNKTQMNSQRNAEEPYRTKMIHRALGMVRAYAVPVVSDKETAQMEAELSKAKMPIHINVSFAK